MNEIEKVRGERDAYKLVNERLRSENRRLRSRLNMIARAVQKELFRAASGDGGSEHG
jgi:hypothetical protein